MQSLFYTSESAAALLQCNPQTVQRLCHSGEITAHKRLRKWYILPDALIQFIKFGQTVSQGATLTKKQLAEMSAADAKYLELLNNELEKVGDGRELTPNEWKELDKRINEELASQNSGNE